MTIANTASSVFNLKASLRNKLGSPESRRLRKSGLIPAVIYGKNGENLNISINGKDFEHQYFKGNILTTNTHIDLDGKKLQVIARKIEFNPVTDRPEHIDFFPFENNQIIKVKSKLNFTNQDKSIGLKKGGFLHIVARKVDILCNSNSIVESIEVDVTQLRVGSKIRNQDLILPEGVKVFGKGDKLIASIIGRGSKDEEKAEGTTGETATAPATTKATAPAASKAPATAKAPAAAKAPAKPAAKK